MIINKSIFKSKTFWVNVLLAVYAVFMNDKALNLNEEQQAVVMMVINIFLRFKTKVPVKL